MPAEVTIIQKGPACWELEVKLRPRRPGNNDAREYEFRVFLMRNDLRDFRDHGWSARGYHTFTIRVGSPDVANKAKELIEKWGEENLPM